MIVSAYNQSSYNYGIKNISQMQTPSEGNDISSKDDIDFEKFRREFDDVASKKEERTKMEQAVKDYRDEYLTGLTDSELEKISKEIDDYVRKNEAKGVKVSDDKLNSLVKGLLKDYGYKGDIDEMCDALINQHKKVQEEGKTNLDNNVDINIANARDAFRRGRISTYLKMKEMIA